ncbi:MAG: AtpZ/AtpI family protein [Pseudomonadota bacterium]
MSDDDPDDLTARIARAKAAREAREHPQKTENSSINAGALALRYGAEFGASVFVGVMIGLLIDGIFDTAPWGLLIMLGFGLAAGVLGVIRAYQEINAEMAKLADPPDKRT